MPQSSQCINHHQNNRSYPDHLAPPVIVDKPIGQPYHLMPPKGQHQQQMDSPMVIISSITGTFQFYKDLSPILTPTRQFSLVGKRGSYNDTYQAGLTNSINALDFKTSTSSCGTINIHKYFMYHKCKIMNARVGTVYPLNQKSTVQVPTIRPQYLKNPRSRSRHMTIARRTTVCTQ